MEDYTERSCYLSHFGHKGNGGCPSCEELPPCSCGSHDFMKIVAPAGNKNNRLEDKWVRCFSCGKSTPYVETFKEALELFYN